MKHIIIIMISVILITGVYHRLFLRYPKSIKSVSGPNGLLAELEIKHHLSEPLWRRLILPEPYDNVEINLVVKQNGEVVKIECLEKMADMIADHDDTTLVWDGNRLTVTEEKSGNRTEYIF